MHCPICKGPCNLTGSVETPTNEVLREKKCFRCGFKFRTKEFVVVEDKAEFDRQWEFYNRVHPSNL